MLVYVDDILAILMNPTRILKFMEGKTVKYKNENIAPPEMYLGTRLKRKMMNGHMCWTITSYDYVVAAVQTIKDELKIQEVETTSNCEDTNEPIICTRIGCN